MDFSNSQDALIALFGTIFGGAGLEIIRRILAKSKEKEDSATAFRNELRTELTSLKVEMSTVEKELDMWRQKYYELFEKYIFIKVKYEEAVKKLTEHQIPLDGFQLPDTPLDKDSLDTAPDGGVASADKDGSK